LYVAQKPISKVLLQQQKSQIEEAIAKAQADYIIRCAQENQISLTELDDILQPIIESCTKDSISNGNYKQHLLINSKA
jgi:calcium homeostasis ER protein